jgi:hypothetical protein
VRLTAQDADHGAELLGDVLGALLHRVGGAQRSVTGSDLLLGLVRKRLVDQMQ